MLLRTKGERVFAYINAVLLGLLSLLVIVPILHVISVSLSSDVAVSSGDVSVWPVDWNLNAYSFIVSNGQYATSFLNSIYVTVVGTACAMLLTVITAYPLSRSGLAGRNAILKYFVITMMLGGNLISLSALIRALNLFNTRTVMFATAIFAPYNMILLKNFLEGIPEAIEESASIDGASSLQILWRITLPLALPGLATIALFYAVGFWNSYFNGVMFISDAAKKPLQTYLYDMLRLTMLPMQNLPEDLAQKISTKGVQNATVVASTLPILIVYPFLQRYFVQGLVVGSVKG